VKKKIYREEKKRKRTCVRQKSPLMGRKNEKYESLAFGRDFAHV